MKYSSITLFALFLIVACNKKEAPGNLHITGNVKGLKKGTLYIQKIVDTSLVAIDTIAIDGNSNFESDLDIKSPEMYYLFLDRGVTNSLDNNLRFFAEEGNIKIETSLDYFNSDAKITGSKNQEKYEEYRKIISRFNDDNLSLMELKFKAFKNGDTKATDSIEAKQNANLKRRYLYSTNFALNNKDYEVAPYIALTEISDINLKYLDTIQKMMTPKVAQSLYGKKLTAFYKERKKLEVK
ncbi:DUF4369 domain-containing protein [Flavobacterium psychrotolerans]|uniref:DUF4369 domain-containing protein n=1 Tax=Flavobacterium psychrotolerans TaxID=2169410 RepID=A0A2U1JG09_9FLAO|nr:DUF4369 domain-containing protein [Flavobacterium psychrotolerans]PWA03878.1 hypothetical protein DB895_13855 [Flavobacterium psychrotolerans]